MVVYLLSITPTHKGSGVIDAGRERTKERRPLRYRKRLNSSMIAPLNAQMSSGVFYQLEKSRSSVRLIAPYSGEHRKNSFCFRL